MSLHLTCRLAVAVVIAVALAAAGCGQPAADGGDPAPMTERQTRPSPGQDYISQMNLAQNRFVAGASKLNLAAASSAPHLGRTLLKLDRLLGNAVADLDRIEPPAVSVEHGQLIGTLTEFRRAVKVNTGKLLSGDRDAAGHAAKAIGRASTRFSARFDRTVAAINRKLR